MAERSFSPGSDLPELRRGVIREIPMSDGTVRRFRAVDASFHQATGDAGNTRANRLGHKDRPRRAF